LDFSCAAAGLNCERLGARGGITTLARVKELQRKGRRHRALFSQAQLERAAQTYCGKRG